MHDSHGNRLSHFRRSLFLRKWHAHFLKPRMWVIMDQMWKLDIDKGWGQSQTGDQVKDFHVRTVLWKITSSVITEKFLMVNEKPQETMKQNPHPWRWKVTIYTLVLLMAEYGKQPPENLSSLFCTHSSRKSEFILAWCDT